MKQLEIKYIHYGGKTKEFLGYSEGISIDRGSLAYWILDKYVQYKLKKARKNRQRMYEEAKKNFIKFKNMIE